MPKMRRPAWIRGSLQSAGIALLTMLLALNYSTPEKCRPWHPLAVGTLAGLGYTIDLGAGPILVLSVRDTVEESATRVEA